jgi:hypothetical protein
VVHAQAAEVEAPARLRALDPERHRLRTHQRRQLGIVDPPAPVRARVEHEHIAAGAPPDAVADRALQNPQVILGAAIADDDQRRPDPLGGEAQGVGRAVAERVEPGRRQPPDGGQLGGRPLQQQFGARAVALRRAVRADDMQLVPGLGGDPCGLPHRRPRRGAAIGADDQRAPILRAPILRDHRSARPGPLRTPTHAVNCNPAAEAVARRSALASGTNGLALLPGYPSSTDRGTRPQGHRDRLHAVATLGATTTIWVTQALGVTARRAPPSPL